MIYLDVRTKKEYDGGHVNGAIHCDVMDIMKGNIPDLPKDADITVYCQSGARSTVAKMLLQQKGFKKVVNGGGIDSIRV
jgi:rhodanese-related sulfurtransferase